MKLDKYSEAIRALVIEGKIDPQAASDALVLKYGEDQATLIIKEINTRTLHNGVELPDPHTKNTQLQTAMIYSLCPGVIKPDFDHYNPHRADMVFNGVPKKPRTLRDELSI